MTKETVSYVTLLRNHEKNIIVVTKVKKIANPYSKLQAKQNHRQNLQAI